MQWNSYSYKVADGGAVVTQYRGGEVSVCVPAQMDGYPVTEIGEEAFTEYGEGIERIELPGTVKKIGENAFKMCMSLTELILHDGLEEIGEDAFFLTPLTSLFVPSTVSRIGKIWELGEMEWTVDERNPHFFCDGYGFYSFTERGQELSVVYQEDERETYRILPGTVRIGQGAFAGQNAIAQVSFPRSLRTVEDGAFEGCENLSRVFMNEGLEEIGENAFGHCVKLTEILLPASLRRLGKDALTNTFGWSDALRGISRIRVEEGNPVFRSDDSALYERRPDGTVFLLKYFGTQASYTVSSEVYGIGQGAFRRAAVRRLVLPDSLRTVKKEAFRGCRHIKEIVFLQFFRNHPDAGEVGSAAAGRTDLLPEARVYVPQDPVYRKDEVMALFLEYGFDFGGYDALFDTYLNLYEQSRMACCRLQYPARLPGETREKYTGFLREHLEEILREICAREDADALKDLTDLEVICGENIDACIEVINRSKKAKLLGYLMNYRQMYFSENEYDYSL